MIGPGSDKNYCGFFFWQICFSMSSVHGEWQYSGRQMHKKYLSWKGEGYKILYKRNDVQRYKSMYICCRPSFFINSSLPSYNFLIAATHIQVILIHNALAVLRKLCFIGTSCPTSYSSRYNKPKQTMKTSVFYLVQRAGTNKMEIATCGQIS